MGKSADYPLLAPLSSLTAYQDLLVRLQEGDFTGGNLRGLGLPRAVRLALLAALHHDIEKPILLLTNRADRALSLFDELSFWLPEGTNLYFAEPNPSFYEDLPWSEGTRHDRLRVLTEFSRYWLPGSAPQTHSVVIAPIRAAMTRTIPRRDFLRGALRVRLSEQRDLVETSASLVRLGYEYSNIVVRPGQFSRRGGILDAWSHSSVWPVRIEFFGPEIDTLRLFDPTTQRTTGKLDQVVLFPASEALALNASTEGELPYQPSELEIPTLYRFPSSLVDYLPKEALVLLDGEEFVEAAANDIEEESTQRRANRIASHDLAEDAPIPYLTWSELADALSQHQLLELGHTNAEGGSSLSAAFTSGPRFAGRLKDYQHHIETLNHTNTTWTVVSRQAARLKQLWSETHPEISSEETQHHFMEGSISGGWILNQGNIQQDLLSDSEIFGWSRPQPRRRPMPKTEVPETAYADLKPGDWVVHVDHGIGKFIGLHTPKIDGVQHEYLTIEYKDNDILYVPIHQSDRVTRYIGPESGPPGLSRLGGADWDLTKSRVRHAVVEVAQDLLELYAKRQTAEGYAFDPDNDWQKELEASFPYIETPDQLLAIQQVKADMESSRPMDRLLCGDVGYGKTEVALRAAFKAVTNGKQVAVLVPTTVLAQQHYETFRQRLSVFPVTVEMLSRFRSNKAQDEIIRMTAEKTVDILIGTHRLLSADVKFKDLGLVIIDEEQRFGVTHKEHLKKLRSEVDVLTLTATPIPRTLYMALSGVRDISNINSPPEERLPIITHVGPYDQKLVREAIVRELDRGGQVFFVHNRIHSIPAVYNHLSTLVPEARIGIGHGRLPEEQLAEVMQQFTAGQIDVLLCTSIIESGLDIPNANTLIIDRADTFGLAQLYQLRGRVGRGAQRAFAYLFRDKRRAPTAEGEERLEVLADNSQLGAGYAIAMRDLEMRGAGDLLGTRQSGYIAAVGFHLYTKLLGQAVKAMRGETGLPIDPSIEAPSLNINVELPLSSEIPTSYIPDQELRLKLYRRIASLRSETEIAQTEIEFGDRFGPVPEGVQDLLYQMKIKLRGEAAGIESISINNNQILLSYPALPNGIKDRGLPDIDPNARAGKNGYWVNITDLSSEEWKTRLLNILQKIQKSLTSA